MTALMDFERAALNAFEVLFPDSALSGGFFHPSSNIWKKVQSLGDQQEYQNNDEFSMHVRMLMVLAFVPGRGHRKRIW